MAYLVKQLWHNEQEGFTRHYYCSDCLLEVTEDDDYTPVVCPRCGAPLKHRRNEFGYWRPTDQRIWLLKKSTKHVHSWVCSNCHQSIKSLRDGLPIVCPSCESFMCNFYSGR